MDNYKKTLYTKLEYIRMMMNISGIVKLPLDWLNVCWTEEDPNIKHTVHTVFRIKSLIDLYPNEFKKFLADNNISKKVDEKGITFHKKA